MKQFAAIALIALILAGQSGRGWGVELLFPPRHASTGYPHLTLVGRSAAARVDVVLDGEVFAQCAVVDGMFHIRVELPAGLNEVVLLPIAEAGEKTTEAPDTTEVIFGRRIDLEIMKIFEDVRFHDDEARKSCLRCHFQVAELDTAEGRTIWCYTCHGDIRIRFSEHSKQVRASCTDCHHIGDDLGMIKAGNYTDSNPCYRCHADKMGEFVQDFMHGPVAGGTCTICHDAHGSRFANTLRIPVPSLCLSCHPTAIPDGARFSHQPFALGRCTECHDPHGANNQWILVKNSEELCLNCHFLDGDLSVHSHPTNSKPRNKRRNKDYPFRLTDEGRLECLSCHEAHTSEGAYLLRTSEEFICIGCHKDYR